MSGFVELEYVAAGGGVSEEEIERAESDLGLRFAKDYRRYLSKCGMMRIGNRELTGIGLAEHLDVVSVTGRWRSYNLGVPDSWYVVEVLGVGGLVAWQNKNGSVYLVSPDGRATKDAASLSEYLEQ